MVGFCRLDTGQEKRALLVKKSWFFYSWIFLIGQWTYFLKEQKT